jgi:hypothetical protein
MSPDLPNHSPGAIRNSRTTSRRAQPQSHLPELLSVPGILSAARYEAVKGGPQYLACYELESVAVMQTPAFTNRPGRQPIQRVLSTEGPPPGFARCEEGRCTGGPRGVPSWGAFGSRPQCARIVYHWPAVDQNPASDCGKCTRVGRRLDPPYGQRANRVDPSQRAISRVFSRSSRLRVSLISCSIAAMACPSGVAEKRAVALQITQQSFAVVHRHPGIPLCLTFHTVCLSMRSWTRLAFLRGKGQRKAVQSTDRSMWCGLRPRSALPSWRRRRR